MKIISSSVKILDNDWSIKGIFRTVERAGRTCYKSVGTRYFRLPEGPENSLESSLVKQAQSDPNVVCKKGTSFDSTYYLSIPNKFVKNYLNIEQFDEEEFDYSPYYENLTAESFVEMLTKNGHGAILEHGTIYLDCPKNIFEKYNSNKFSKGIIINTGETRGEGIYTITIYKYYVATNLRVLIENDWLDDLKYVCEPTDFHPKRVMVRFICDRGVSHEIVRHRGKFGMSFAQESTRYCNYSLNKFNGELTFIEPAWEFPTSEIVNTRERFEAMLYEAEANYMELITLGFKPQEARAILPNAIKTEIVVTGFIDDWKHFFELRCDNAAHPDIRKLALDLQKQFIDRNLI